MRFLLEVTSYSYWFLLYFSLAWMKGEPSFHLFGFIMCIAATAARALKTVLQGVLLRVMSSNFQAIVLELCWLNEWNIHIPNIVSFWFFGQVSTEMISLISQGKAQFYEPSYVHGTSGCCIPSSSLNHNGGRCHWNHNFTCQRGFKYFVVAYVQFCIGIFCQFDQFLSHKAHQCINTSGNHPSPFPHWNSRKFAKL